MRVCPRLWPKGACARCLSGFPTSGFGRRSNSVTAVKAEVALEIEPAGDGNERNTTARKVGPGLTIGILLAPYVFAWFLLRKGYSKAARLIAFSWLGIGLLGMAAVGSKPDANSPKGRAITARDIADAKNAALIKKLEEAERVAKRELAEKERREKESAERDEKRRGMHCLNGWDGSHWDMQDAIKDNLRNPRSFDHIQTAITPVDEKGVHRVIMKYRAENGFGGMNIGQAIGIVDHKTCKLLRLEM